MSGYKEAVFLFLVLSVSSGIWKAIGQTDVKPNNRMVRHFPFGGQGSYSVYGHFFPGIYPNTDGFECPYPYTVVDGMCLYANDCSGASGYNFSRQICQTLGKGGGDLAFYTNAEEFENIIGFLFLKNPQRTCNYWLGASDALHEGVWVWTNPNIPPLPNNDISWVSFQPDGKTRKNYLYMDSSKFYRVNDELGTTPINNVSVTALCRYVPSKHDDDHVNFYVSYPSSHEHI